eukprot:CAMPEP_0117001536 /NCGR_PEP_ID=MMETSP0472-20121206/3505_1 /TAXON_ID=693140 ORGANISM="Tiarina fusus, Strain LIS" /NCGR_SAMPLE_ID=MMETSP0472 /ASSEMBLY_ACC=CAM_ASM_000603 /LENGTH=53 /DNA_ID=CAMNT_0004701581 /DNA_START=50 /DNA_END=211 /DNA_ORIENTATION=+
MKSKNVSPKKDFPLNVRTMVIVGSCMMTVSMIAIFITGCAYIEEITCNADEIP